MPKSFAGWASVGLFAFGALFGSAPAAQAGYCECYCSIGPNSVEGEGPSCATNAQCTQAYCATYCADLGATPGRLRGSRVYTCVESAAAPTPVGETPSAPPAAPPPGGTPASPTPSSPGGTPASPSSPTAGQTRGAPASANGSQGSSAAASGGGLRFELPACTETGNCSLTDIVNTGIRFANFLLALSGIVFLGTFLFAGAKLLFFAYDSKAIGSAQQMMVGAVTGIVIIMVAGVAVRFVSSSLGVSSATTRLPGATTSRSSGSAGTANGASSSGGSAANGASAR